MPQIEDSFRPRYDRLDNQHRYEFARTDNGFRVFASRSVGRAAFVAGVLGHLLAIGVAVAALRYSDLGRSLSGSSQALVLVGVVICVVAAAFGSAAAQRRESRRGDLLVVDGDSVMFPRESIRTQRAAVRGVHVFEFSWRYPERNNDGRRFSARSYRQIVLELDPA